MMMCLLAVVLMIAVYLRNLLMTFLTVSLYKLVFRSVCLSVFCFDFVPRWQINVL